MKVLSSATPLRRATFFSANAGIGWGCLAVFCFSLSFPATKLAVESLSSLFVTGARACIAACIAGLVLTIGRKPLPRRYWLRISVVSCGVVVGFPLLSAFAVRLTGAAHTAVLVSLLPTVTALMGVVRGGERPSASFWLAAGGGLVTVLIFTLVQGGGGIRPADLLTLAAICLAAIGYAEGGALSRELGATQVISWAVVFALPVTLPIVIACLLLEPPSAGVAGWGGLAYVGVVSMYLAFLAWYKALASGGVARISQLQLAQPILTLFWSAVFLGESVGLAAVVTALLVLVSVVLSQRARVSVPTTAPRVPEPVPGLPYSTR